MGAAVEARVFGGMPQVAPPRHRRGLGLCGCRTLCFSELSFFCSRCSVGYFFHAHQLYTGIHFHSEAVVNLGTSSTVNLTWPFPTIMHKTGCFSY